MVCPGVNSIEFGILTSSNKTIGASWSHTPVNGGEFPAMARPRISTGSEIADVEKKIVILVGAGMHTPTNATCFGSSWVSPARSTSAGVAPEEMSAQLEFE